MSDGVAGVRGDGAAVVRLRLVPFPLVGGADQTECGFRSPSIGSRIPHHHTQAIHLGQQVNQFLCEPVAEVVVLTAGAEIGERQHGDGGPLLQNGRRLGGLRAIAEHSTAAGAPLHAPPGPARGGVTGITIENLKPDDEFF